MGENIMANAAIQGTNESEFLKGTLEDDWIRGLAGNDTLRGGLGNDRLYGHADDDILYGDGGNDKLYGNTGNDTLYGGGGNDIFYYYSGDGNDVIGDYQNNAKAKNSDSLNITNGTVKAARISSNDVVFTVGNGTVTMKNAAAKTIKLKDSRGSYMMSKTGLTLSSNFTGTMDAAQYLSTITAISGKSATKTVRITGNRQSNTITGGKGADYLDGGVGHDTLTGGAGKDTFAYAASTGRDVVTDYSADDLLYVTGGSVAKTALTNKDKDVVFTVGSGTVTMKNAATKSIRLKDSRGNYTMTKSGLSLSSNFKGTLNSAYYLATITSINGSSAANAVTLYGNAQNNTIKGGKVADKLYGRAGKDKILGNAGNDTLYGEAGNDSLYGGAGNDYLSGGANNDYLDGGANNDKLYGGAGDDRLLGNAGVDYLYGEAGNDNLNGGVGDDYLYGGANDDTLTGAAGKDIFVFAANTGKDIVTDYMEKQDTLYISSGSISKVALANSNKDMVFTVGSGTVTLNGAAAKTITVKDSRGTYAMSKLTLTLTNTSKGTFKAATFLPTITNINGSKATTAVILYGNAKNNTINGGSKNDKLYGSAGNNKLYGNAGNDILTGGAGKDSLYGGDGKDSLAGGLGDDYLSGGAGDDTLGGGDGNDILYAGSGTDYLYGGNGDDVLYANAGTSYLYGNGDADTFVVDANTVQNVYIYDFAAGTDKLKVLNSSNVHAKVEGNNVVLTMGNSTVKLTGVAGKVIDIFDVSGKRVAGLRVASDTQQNVLKNLMGIMDKEERRAVDYNEDSFKDIALATLNKAIFYASNNLYGTVNDLVNSFVSALRNFTGTAEQFLLNYCGINLSNDDTGAITGYDARGSAYQKNAVNIVPESGSLSTSVNSSNTIEGLTFNWHYSTSAQKSVVQHINTWWAKEGLQLIARSYGLSFKEAGTTVKSIDVYFEDTTSNTNVASVTPLEWYPSTGKITKLKLTINMAYYSKYISASDVNGEPNSKVKDPTTGGYYTAAYLDRTLAHELTHAVMAANINYFSYLPAYIKEGTAELVHGIDDFRKDDLIALAGNTTKLLNALQNNTKAIHENYAAGYMLLRYLAKRVADCNSNGGVILSWGGSGCAGSPLPESSASAPLLTDSSAMLVGSADAQLSSLVSATTSGNVGSMATSGTGLASVDASGSSLAAATGVDANNPLTNKNKIA